MTTQVTSHPCPRCKAKLAWVTEQPEKGTGCIVALLGALFTPILLGIPVLIYGFHLMGKTKRYWHCTGCGTKFPA